MHGLSSKKLSAVVEGSKESPSIFDASLASWSEQEGLVAVS